MKKFKSTKAKIATGVIAATVIGSSTFAFANTNAGEQFKAWADKQIQTALNTVSGSIDASRATALADEERDANADRDTAEGRINGVGDEESKTTATAINDKLKEHIDSLESEFQAYMISVGEDFTDLVSDENGDTTDDFKALYTRLSSNIETVLKAAKDRNVKEVTEESLLVKGEATSKLIQKINQVKSDLQAEINRLQGDAQDAVDEHLQDEVDDFNSLLAGLIADLEEAAGEAIATAGQAVEDSAIANFENVIALTQTNTPIEVDEQKLAWDVNLDGWDGLKEMFDGNITFTVTNENAFDVVFKYTFEGVFVDKWDEDGVRETLSAESSAKPGVTTMTFKNAKVPAVGSAVLKIEYLDENGVWQDVDQLGGW
ncbi:hypothetical protein [Neobacillus niacini]|uniref:hypothetical protein n=1 Tax=Neobacillus niacini TaxID=86668 RepID=UPI00398391C7